MTVEFSISHLLRWLTKLHISIFYFQKSPYKITFKKEYPSIIFFYFKSLIWIYFSILSSPHLPPYLSLTLCCPLISTVMNPLFFILYLGNQLKIYQVILPVFISSSIYTYMCTGQFSFMPKPTNALQDINILAIKEMQPQITDKIPASLNRSLQ